MKESSKIYVVSFKRALRFRSAFFFWGGEGRAKLRSNRREGLRFGASQAFSKPIADLFIGAVAKKNPLSSKKCLIILFFYYISLLL